MKALHLILSVVAGIAFGGISYRGCAASLTSPPYDPSSHPLHLPSPLLPSFHRHPQIFPPLSLPPLSPPPPIPSFPNRTPKGIIALLKTIQIAEGTLHPDNNNKRNTTDDPYRTVLGGSILPVSNTVYKDHPRSLRYNLSDAAGAYQFLSTTWDTVSKELNLKDFTPLSQSKGAIHLISKTVTPQEFHLIRQGILPRSAVFRLSTQWASLPYYHGYSYYSGQRSLRVEQVLKIYNIQYKELIKNDS